jgi:hypothetical protein
MMKLAALALVVALSVSVDAANLRSRADPAPTATTGGLSVEAQASIDAQQAAANARDSTSEAAETSTRDNRQSGFSNIETLLAKLRAFVASERARVDKDHQADVTKAENQRESEIKEADRVRNDKIEVLRLMVEAKTQDRDTKQGIYDGKVAVHDSKVSAHQEAEASLAAAKSIQEKVSAEAVSAHADASASCKRNDERSVSAAAAQLKKDQSYLDEALTFIADLRKQLTTFQGGAETALLSVEERVRLHQLLSAHVDASPKYLAEARITLREGQVDAINKAMALVETRVREEKADVDTRHAANLKAIAKELADCQNVADEARDAALDNMQATVDRATTDEKNTRAARKIAKDEMDEAKRILDEAEQALTTALQVQEEETALANDEFERNKLNSINNFNQAKAGFDQKESDAYTYLDGEVDLINQIETALKSAGAIGTQKLMMLAEMSQRLTNHVKRRLQARYVDSLQGQSGLRDRINEMLAGIEQALTKELADSKAQFESDTKLANDFYTTTEATAKATMTKKLNDLQDAVDAATAAKAKAKSELDTAKAEEAVALAAMQAADAVHKAMLKQQVEQTIVAKNTLASEHAEQTATKAQNMRIVDSKKEQGRTYLAQERATVENIRKMLANLGKDYKFEMPEGATSFLAIKESAGQKLMTVEQKEALATLVSLLGQNGIKYTGVERTFDGSDHAANQAIIDDVLNQVVAAIGKSEAEVDANHKKDTEQVEAEFQAAWDASEAKYAKEIARLQKEVDDAKADLDQKTATFNAKKKVREDKQAVYDQKSAALDNALDTQRIQGDFARKTYAADKKAADTYRSNRLEAVNAERASDLKYIGEEQTAIKEIREALAQINFAMLIESAAKYDADQKTYMATNSFDLKTQMLALLAGIEDNVNAELERADREFKDDTNNNKLEKLRADDEAKNFRDTDLASLQKAVDDARDEFKASDVELDASTKAHSLASDKHQEDRDDLATAKKIESTNAPVFEAEYQKSKRNAGQVYAEEMEMLDNKKDRGDFYLSTNTQGLASVKNLLTHLDVTTTDTVDTPNRKAYAKRAEYTTKLADERFAARTAAETARVDTYHEGAVKSFEVTSTNGDKITVAKGPDGEVDRVLTKSSDQSSGYGFRQEFDDRGNLVGTKSTSKRACTYQDLTALFKAGEGRKNCAGFSEESIKAGPDGMCPCFLEFTAEEAVKLGSCTPEGSDKSIAEGHQYCSTKWTAQKKAEAVDKAAKALETAQAAFLQTAEPEKVGSFIGALERAANDEKAKSQAEYDAEAAQITGTRDTLVGKAKSERDRLLKIDDDRREAAEAAHQVSLEALEAALARKTKATKRHATAAAVLNDALVTQEKMVPLVNKQYGETIKYNEDTAATAAKSIQDKKQEADQYLNDELAMISKVRELVNAKLGLKYPQLLEMVAHLVTTRASRMGMGRYEFKVRESQRMSDQQDKAGKDYMENGTVERNDYGSKVTSIDGMLDANADRITQEIKDVSDRHAADMAFLTKERADALAAAKKKRDDTVAALQAIVDAAQAAFDAAFKARATQQKIRDNARAIYDAKQGELDAALELQANNMTAETNIKDDTDAATQAHFKRMMQHYDDEEARAHGIIKREQGILAQIRGILSDEKLGAAAAEGAKVDKCVAEKNAVDAAVKVATASGSACANAKVNQAGNKPFDATACATAEADAATATAANAAYKACLANPASDLVQAALLETNRLAAKYIEAGKYNKATADDIADALKVLDELDATLLAEDKKVTDSAAQDRVDETNLRDAKLAAALARWTKAKDFHIAAVTHATKVRDETKAEWEKQYAEWARLLDIQNTKDEELRAAKAKYVNEKAIAEALKVQEDLAAETRYSTEKGKVDDIKRKDTKYLNSELGAIADLKKMVAELNAKGL